MKTKKVKKALKTITLDHPQLPDNPSLVLCQGHVDANTFNKAFQAEGWSDPGEYRKKDLRHEYWVKQKRSWKKATISHPKAIAVTVVDWD